MVLINVIRNKIYTYGLLHPTCRWTLHAAEYAARQIFVSKNTIMVTNTNEDGHLKISKEGLISELPMPVVGYLVRNVIITERAQ